MLPAVLRTLEETLDSVKIVWDGIPVVIGPRLGHFISVNHSLVADNTITGWYFTPSVLAITRENQDIRQNKILKSTIQQNVTCTFLLQISNVAVTRTV